MPLVFSIRNFSIYICSDSDIWWVLLYVHVCIYHILVIYIHTYMKHTSFYWVFFHFVLYWFGLLEWTFNFTECFIRISGNFHMLLLLRPITKRIILIDFLSIESPLITWNKSYLFMIYYFLNVVLDSVHWYLI